MNPESRRRWTTVALRTDLHRRLKARASLRGENLGELLDAVVERYLEGAARAEQLVEIVKAANGSGSGERGAD